MVVELDGLSLDIAGIGPSWHGDGDRAELDWSRNAHELAN